MHLINNELIVVVAGVRGLLPGVGSDGGCDPEPFGEVRAGAHPGEVRARADSARGLPHHDVLERPVSSGIMLNVTQYGNVVWFRKKHVVKCSYTKAGNPQLRDPYQEVQQRIELGTFHTSVTQMQISGSMSATFRFVGNLSQT